MFMLFYGVDRWHGIYMDEWYIFKNEIADGFIKTVWKFIFADGSSKSSVIQNLPFFVVFVGSFNFI
jgi:hypothetical protein